MKRKTHSLARERLAPFSFTAKASQMIGLALRNTSLSRGRRVQLSPWRLEMPGLGRTGSRSEKPLIPSVNRANIWRRQALWVHCEASGASGLAPARGPHPDAERNRRMGGGVRVHRLAVRKIFHTLGEPSEHMAPRVALRPLLSLRGKRLSAGKRSLCRCGGGREGWGGGEEAHWRGR